MTVFRCNLLDLVGSDGSFLDYLFNGVTVSTWCNVNLYELVKNNLVFSPKNIKWISDNYNLNPMFSVEAVSKAAKENRGGVSPLGSKTGVKPYMIPTMEYNNNYSEIFIIITPDCFGILQPKCGFILVGSIYSKNITNYFYVYASTLTFSEPLDSRIANVNEKDKLFMCFPANTSTFYGTDAHNLYINVESYKKKQSMRLQVGVDKYGNPIYAMFAFNKDILNFDTCVLSNAVPEGIHIPNERYFINETPTAHPKNVNTLNSITNVKLIDIFVRDGDRPTFYKFFCHIDHLAYCSSYNFTYWYSTKINYPVKDRHWFLWDVYSDATYHGLALLVDFYPYFSATKISSKVTSWLGNFNNRIDYVCNFVMPSNIYNVDTSHIHNYDCDYGGIIPTGSIVITEYSPIYTIFFGNEDKVVWKKIDRTSLVEKAKNGDTFTLNDDDNNFSVTFSFYSNLWNVLVPVSYNCVIFDISRYVGVDGGGDFGVISSVQ